MSKKIIKCRAIGWLLVIACILWIRPEMALAVDLSGVINTYYPGTGTATAGSHSVQVNMAGKLGAGHVLQLCDQVLIIQMVDATINSTNTSSYGDGSTGSGLTALNNTGLYEYAVVESVSGNTVQLTTVLQNSYNSANASKFQVIHVPNHASVRLTGNVTPTKWNGLAGGVVAMQVQGLLNFNGSTINAGVNVVQSAFGSVGGIGSEAFYNGSDFSAFVIQGTTVVAGADTAAKVHGQKGAGIAGIQADYEAHWQGSYGRGAPANGGGGGGSVNAGGGGGANGGKGGDGGGTYSTARAFGGLGGSAITDAAFQRVLMGGGGGGGQQNNGIPNGQTGGNGGGIVIVKAGSVSGTGTINVDGAVGLNNAVIDGGGGGGGGGTIVLRVASGTLSGITLSAKGGGGASSGSSGEGGGGGGGGGRVITNASGATITVTAGAAGSGTAATLPTAGTTGVFTTSATLSAVTPLSTCVTLNKALGSSRADSAHQFTVRILDGSTLVGSTSGSTTNGSGSTVTAGTGTSTHLVTPGTTYTLTETASDITILDVYRSNISCTNGTTGSATTLPSGAGRSFNVTPVAGDIIVCALTNTAAAALNLSKTGTVSMAKNGDTFSYTVSIRNSSQVNASTATKVRDIIPVGITVTSITANSGWTCTKTPSSGNIVGAGTTSTMVECTASSALAFSSTTSLVVTINAIVTAALNSNSSKITNTAEVQNGGGDDTCATSSGPMAGAPSRCRGVWVISGFVHANIAVTKNDSMATYSPGTLGTYTIVVSNTGVDSVNNININDSLPAGMTLSGAWSCTAGSGSSCVAASGGSSGGTQITVVADIASNSSISISVPVKYASSAEAY